MATRKVKAPPKGVRKTAAQIKASAKRAAKKRKGDAKRAKLKLQAKLIEDHEKAFIGRPNEYEPALARIILDCLAAGESLVKICALDGMPHRITVMRWAREDVGNDDFRNRYAMAREDGLRLRADEIVEIADDSSADFKTIFNKAGDEITVVDHEAIQRSKLRVDTRCWELGRLLGPYRDRQEVTHKGTVSFHAPEDSDPTQWPEEAASNG